MKRFGWLDRREVLQSSAVALGGILGGCQPPPTETDILWASWQDEWLRMEAHARRRRWQVTPFVTSAPASQAALASVERRHGLSFPPQLRTLLTRYAESVAFGWHVPSHLRPLELLSHPTSSGLRGHAWDLTHIDDHAIPNFLGWKRDLAARDVSEAPNPPELWENQFPFANLVNGDLLTIDVSKPDGAQPVRYFSHELEGLHGLALAPDLFSFVTVLSRLGWAGTEQDSWGRFLEPKRGDTRYLSASTAGAREWLAWVAADPGATGPDEPPLAIVAETTAERALLEAASAGSSTGIVAALAAGARIDVVPDAETLLETGEWNREFATAVTHAVRNDDVPMLELLVKNGATLDTRRLPLAEAVEHASLATVRWLIARGVRTDGWKHQRYWPLHGLVTRRGEATPQKAAKTRDAFTKAGVPVEEADRLIAQVESAGPKPLDPQAFLAMLDAVLDAGAAPDAPWDNGITMLMWGGSETARRLLAHGASVHARDMHGRTPLHWVQSADKARLLVANGADINDRATPGSDDDLGITPLQAHLIGRSFEDGTILSTLLDLGADPKVRDGDGRSTLAYCGDVPDVEAMRAYGLDPFERLPGGGTLIHNLARMSARPLADKRALLDHLVGLGLSINAVDEQGRTFLHLLAAQEMTQPEDIEAVVALGADRTIRDAAGRRAADHAPKSHVEVRVRLDG